VDEEKIVADMLEKADRRQSFDDIWTVSSGNISLFYYTIRMVPWFTYLLLARARYRGIGGNTRKLEIVDSI